MKTTIILVGMIIMSASCSSPPPPKNTFNLDVKLQRTLTEAKLCETGEISYNYSLRLSNSSNDTVSLWIMSCSWSDNILSDNQYIRVQYFKCDKNQPTKVRIEPHKALKFESQLCCSKINKGIEQSFKLGFILIRDNEVTQFADFYPILMHKINNLKDVIWSNTLIISN